MSSILKYFSTYHYYNMRALTEQMTVQMVYIHVKPESVHFVTCPKQGREMEAVVLHRMGFLVYSCPKQGQDFKPSVAPLYPNMGQVPLHPPDCNSFWIVFDRCFITGRWSVVHHYRIF